MKLHPRLTRAAVELVRRFETFQPQAERTAQGGWSIGYGHTRSARPGAHVSAADAEALLLFDLDASARVVARAVFAPLNQRQFEALTAFCFNVGEAAFLRSSALARLNAGAELDAADEIERWRRAELGGGPQVVDALVRRRAAEKAHFLGLPEGAAKWPSARLRPLAAEGGDTSEDVPSPGDIASPAASATLSAADDVQARLRRLIPETPADEGFWLASAPAIVQPVDDASMPQAPVAPEASPAEPDEPVWDAAETRDAQPALPTEVESDHRAEQAAEIPWATDPPPFDAPVTLDAPSTDIAPETLQAGDPGLQTVVSEPARLEPAPRAMPDVVLTPPPPRDRKLLAVSLVLIGLVLFGVAIILILSGRPGLPSLALGVVGAILIVPGIYGLLAPPRAQPLSDTPSAG